LLLAQSSVVLGNGPLWIKPLRIKDMSEAQPTEAALRFSAWIVLPFEILVQKGFPVKLSYAYDSCLHKKPKGDFFWV
jgi:hypothetical protein